MAASAPLLGVVAVALLLGCDEAPAACEEDPVAQVIPERVDVQVFAASAGDASDLAAPLVTLSAELADEQVERERGWRARTCDLEALLMLQDSAAPLGIWGCGLREPIAVAFVRDHVVVGVIDELVPCDAPCLSCPIIGDDLVVDAVLELGPGQLKPELDQRVEYEP